MVGFTGWSSEGHNVLANSLSGLGKQFGDAYSNSVQQGQKLQQRQLLGDLVSKGDYKGAANQAFAAGELDAGVKLLEQDMQNTRMTNGQAALSQINGTSPYTPSNIPPNSNPTVTTPTTSTTTTPSTSSSTTQNSDAVTKMIADKAKALGIDPAIAIQVYKSEGGSGYTGDSGSSHGPYQLHYGGVAGGGNAVAGLGDEFTRQTGLDARDPKTVPQQIDFALNYAKKNGWGAFHGWKGDPRAGLNGGSNPPPPVQTASNGSVDALLAKRENIKKYLSSPMDEASRAQLNMLYKDTEFQIERLDKQAANVPEFNKKVDAKLADKFDAISTERDGAINEKAMLGQLNELSSSFDTGSVAAAQSWLSKFGVTVGDNVDKVQAYEAIVNKLIPTQRIPGAGSTSDFDAKGFAASLPGLMKTPEGNRQIISTLNALSDYKIARGEISDKVMSGEMTPQEGIKALRGLKVPTVPAATKSPDAAAKGVDANAARTELKTLIAQKPELKDQLIKRFREHFPNENID